MKRYLIRQCMKRGIDEFLLHNVLSCAEYNRTISNTERLMLIRWVWLNKGHTWEVIK